MRDDLPGLRALLSVAQKKSFTAAVVVLSLIAIGAASERRENDIDRLQTSSVVLKQIMDAPDSAIPDSIMSGAKCIAIIPSTLKAGFIVGANASCAINACKLNNNGEGGGNDHRKSGHGDRRRPRSRHPY